MNRRQTAPPVFPADIHDPAATQGDSCEVCNPHPAAASSGFSRRGMLGLIGAGAGGLLLGGLGDTVISTGRAAAAEPDTRRLTLAIANDFHGRLNEATVRWAGTVEEIRSETADSLFLSAGDNFGNSLFASSIQKDSPTVAVLNALDLDASAVGNGEFFVGYDDFMGRLRSEAQFPYLGANVTNRGTGEPLLTPYVVLDVNGIRVATIGVVTPDTQVQFSQNLPTDPLFTDTVAALNEAAAAIVAGNEADVIVALIHEGGGLNSPPATLADEEAAGGVLSRLINEASSDIDVLVTAHTHNVYAYDAAIPGVTGRTRPVLQAGSFGSYVGRVTIDLDPATLEVREAHAQVVALTTSTDADLIATYPRIAAVKTIVDDALAYAEEAGNAEVGRVSADITTAWQGGSYTDTGYRGGSGGDRTKESALATLVANMFRDLQQDRPQPPQFGITLPNFVRSDILYGTAGIVTYSKVKEILSIGDVLATADVTGAQLKTLFEQQWQRTEAGESRGYIQLALSDNLTYTYDSTRPEGDRITSITLNGQPVVADGTYRAGLSAAIMLGLVNFHVAKQFTNADTTDIVDSEGFLRYLPTLGTVSPDFRKHGTEVTGLPASIAPGATLEFDVSALDMTSLGAPANTRLEVAVVPSGSSTPLGLGEAAVGNGAAHVSVALPTGVGTGTGMLRLTAQPSGSVVSRSIGIAVPPPVATKPPTISGTAVVGRALTASPGTWSPAGVSIAYQWLRDGQPIANATARTYRVARADVGHALSVQVTASRAGASATATSDALFVRYGVQVTASMNRPFGTRADDYTVAVRVKPSGGPAATGTVTARVGRDLLTATLVDGAATLNLPKQTRGAHSVRVDYGGSATVEAGRASTGFLVLR